MVKTSYQSYQPQDHGLNLADFDQEALKIIYRLQQHNHQAYIVGGGVRDLLLRKKPKDFDIATDATPQQIKRIFQNCRIIGRRFKLAHIYFRGNKTIEVATFRQETDAMEVPEEASGEIVISDNNFGTIATDALRRDLTINALFFDPSDGIIHDYVGGFQDFKNRIIKIIGKPEIRFQEDPVRIIRTIRHLAKTGFKLDHKTEDAIKKSVQLLATCSEVRIFDELRKDLLSGYFQEITELLNRYQVLEIFLPEITQRVNADSLLLKDLSSCIKGLDRYALESATPSLNIPLTILALFAHQQFQLSSNFTEIFENQQAVSDFYRQSYPKLQVPKKIKRDCSDLTRYLWQIENALNKKKTFRLRVEELKDDLKIVLRILNINQSRASLNKIFKFL